MIAASVLRRTGLLAPAVLGAALLAGCGGSSEPAAGAATSTTAAASPSSEVSSSSAPASSTPAAAAAAEPQLVPVPTQDDGKPGLKNATEFPIPAGATVDDSLGAPFNGSWQFSVGPTSPQDLAAFYAKVLPPLGYTVSTDAKIVVGANDVAFLVGWTGPTSGTVGSSGMVSVNDRPADGLTLDGTLVGDPAN